MELIERQVDAVTGNANLVDLNTLENFPVFMGCVNQPEKDDLTAEMTWCICPDTGFLQLKKLIPIDILYQEQHVGSPGNIWANHHRGFAKFLNKFKPSAIFEIGGAHGILANEYSKISDITWTILEPNPSPREGVKARFIKGFFDNSFRLNEYFDTFVHSHVFEHIYEPDEFMNHLSSFIDEGKNLIFSIPNMQVMLERKYTNCINFEHTTFLTEPYVDYLLAKHGFRLIGKEYFMEDHSIFYAAVRDLSVKPVRLPQGLYEKNKKLYQDYVRYHEKLIAELNQKIRAIKQPVYLFGAHVFTQYLMAFGLDISRIACLLDNDPNKQGKRLYGTSLHVYSPKILKNINSPVVILKAGVYNNEIKEDIVNNINPNVEFWE